MLTASQHALPEGGRPISISTALESCLTHHLMQLQTVHHSPNYVLDSIAPFSGGGNDHAFREARQ